VCPAERPSNAKFGDRDCGTEIAFSSAEVSIMEVAVEHIAGMRFSARTRSHSLITDQPFENGGSDAGMTPSELLLASFGACAGICAAQYLKSQSLSLEGLEIRVRAEKAGEPALIASLRIEVYAPSATGTYEQGLLGAVRGCLVHNTLLHRPVIETVVNETKLLEAVV
jgi:uncharacterized OsmC-like protein